MILLLKVLAGSRAYGLDTPESDWDIKGCFCHPKEDWFSLEPQLQIIEHKAADGYTETINGQECIADSTLFEIRNFYNLLLKNNPNFMECLFVEEKHILQIHPALKILFDQRELILSKLTHETYVGYAIAQIKRAETHRKWLLDPPQKQPQRSDYDLPAVPEFRKDQINAFLAYLARMVEYNKKHFTLLENAPNLLLRDVICSTPAERLSELGELFALDTNFIDLIKREKKYEQDNKNWKSYLNWTENRNEKRYALEAKSGYDSKNIMHCIRLLNQALEILQKRTLTVDRTNIDADYLREIKNGKYSYDEIKQITDKLKEDISKAANSTDLRKLPDTEKLKEIYTQIISECLG